MMNRFSIVLMILVGLMIGVVVAAPPKNAKSVPKTARANQTQPEKNAGEQSALQVEPVNPGLFLLRDPLVQTELKLTDPQKTAARVLAAEFNEPIWRFRDASVDSDVALKEARLINSQLEPRLAGLLDDKQRSRLDGIVLQVQGADALAYSATARRLSLSADQQGKIAKLTAAARETMSKLRTESAAGKDPVELNRRAEKVQTGLQRDLQAVLTKSQRELWIELRGAELDLSKLQPLTARAPELRGVTAWINSEPLSLEELRGKVVALHFWSFG
jgi:hypothetical protein